MSKVNLLKFTENKVLNRVLTWGFFPAVIAALVVVIVLSIMAPVNFNKQKAKREAVGIERLQDIRTLQDAYKSVHQVYAADMDTLKYFYENEKIVVKMQIGSKDDSLAYAHTKEIKGKVYWLRGQQLNQYLAKLYDQGDKNLVFTIENPVPVKDTLFNDRPNFNIDSLRYIPFSGGREVEMETVVKTVSGVKVPLFEARMPYRYLLYGLDNQLRINLDADRRNGNKYEGLQVGSVSAPNNNAGNWE